MGQVSDPYPDDDDDLGITISDLPGEPVGASAEATPEGEVPETADDDLIDDLEVDLSDWSTPEHDAVTRHLVDQGIRHHWDEFKLYVPRAEQERVDVILDDVGGVGEPLDNNRNQVAYDLSDWDDDRLMALGDALDEAGVAFDWDGEELFAYEDDEQLLDQVIDGVAHPHELDVESDEGDAGAELLGELFIASDRLQNDPDNHEMSVTLLDLSRVVDKAAVPYGLAEKEWQQIKDRVEILSRALTDSPIDENTAGAAASELRNTVRPYV